MKKINLILLIILLYSCTTQKYIKQESQNIKLWNIKSYRIDGIDYVDNFIKDSFLTYNKTTKKSYITYILTDEAANILEHDWRKVDNKIKLDRINIIQEINYRLSRTKVVIINVKTDFVLEGSNTEKVKMKINQLIYSDRSNKSEGLIPLIYRIWNPTVIERIPYPKLNTNDSFYIKADGENINLTSDGVSIDLDFTGEHQWIGY